MYMNDFCLHVCLYSTCVSSTYIGQNRVLNPLELELLLMGVSHHGGTGN